MPDHRAQLDRIERMLNALIAHKDEIRALARRATEIGIPTDGIVKRYTRPKSRKKPVHSTRGR